MSELGDDDYAAEGEYQTIALRSKDKMPKMPDLSASAQTPKRPSPFILDDFRGSNAYRRTKV